jgi:hypothetical protein
MILNSLLATHAIVALARHPFLTPRVGQLHSIDNPHGELVMKTSDAKWGVSKLISLGRGEKVAMDSPLRLFFEAPREELLNVELMNLASNEAELTAGDVVGRLDR